MASPDFEQDAANLLAAVERAAPRLSRKVAIAVAEAAWNWSVAINRRTLEAVRASSFYANAPHPLSNPAQYDGLATITRIEVGEEGDA